MIGSILGWALLGAWALLRLDDFVEYLQTLRPGRRVWQRRFPHLRVALFWAMAPLGMLGDGLVWGLNALVMPVPLWAVLLWAWVEVPVPSPTTAFGFWEALSGDPMHPLSATPTAVSNVLD